MLPLVLEWNELEKVEFSDINTLINLIKDLAEDNFMFDINYKDLTEQIIDIFDEWGFIDGMVDIILNFLANNDPYFSFRSLTDIFLLSSIILIIFITCLDIFDALDKGPDINIVFNAAVILVGFGVFLTGGLSMISTNSDYKKEIAINYAINGILMMMQGIFELLIQYERTWFWLGMGLPPNEANKRAEEDADWVGTGFELALEAFGLSLNFIYIEDQQDSETAWKWSVADALYSFPDAVLALIDPEKHAKVLKVLVVLIAAGLGYTGYLTFKPEDWS